MSAPLFAGEPGTVNFTRSGADRLESASFGFGESLIFTYDHSYGQLTGIADDGESGFSLELASDAFLHLPLSQTVTDETGDALLSATIAYDSGGLRASRTVSAGSQGESSSTTNYWYGGSLHPLVITRDGVDYRLIGKEVVEALGNHQPTLSYLSADRLGSVRMVTDDRGHVLQSLGYDTDYGLTHIAGHSTASTDDGVASFYRFQGQEQETFPLTKLGIQNGALASWLDRIQLYHFPWRDYAAGFAAFTQTDPIPMQDSLYAALGANPVNVTDEMGGIAVLLNTDTRAQGLLYEVRLNGGIYLSPEDRRYLWDLLQEVRAETPDNIAREVTYALPLWTNRYQNALQEWLEAIEWEITQDLLWARSDHQFTQEEHDGIRLDAEAIAGYIPPDKAVAFALDELTNYQLLDSPEKRTMYEQYRSAWLSAHERQIEKLNAQTLSNGDGNMISTPQQETQSPATETSAAAADQDFPVERSAAQEDDEKAEYEVKDHDEKSHEPHGQMPDEDDNKTTF